MKSTKFLLTSIVCLILAISILFLGAIEKQGATGTVVCGIFMFFFLVFFILGWIFNDKPRPPKHDTTEKNKTE